MIYIDTYSRTSTYIFCKRIASSRSQQLLLKYKNRFDYLPKRQYH